MRRFYGTINENRFIITGDELHHLSRVTGVGIGDRIVIIGPDQEQYRGRVDAINSREATGTALEKMERPEQRAVHVYFPLIKHKPMDAAVRIGAEFDATSFTPVVTGHSLRKYSDIDTQIARWRRISGQARKQSGAMGEMMINRPLTLPMAIEHAVPGAVNVVMHPRPAVAGTNTLSGQGQALPLQGYQPVNLWLGPEAGFTEEEIALFIPRHPVFINIGSSILRAETALAAGLGIIHYLGFRPL